MSGSLCPKMPVIWQSPGTDHIWAFDGPGSAISKFTARRENKGPSTPYPTRSREARLPTANKQGNAEDEVDLGG